MEEHGVCHPWFEVVDVVAATVVRPGGGRGEPDSLLTRTWLPGRPEADPLPVHAVVGIQAAVGELGLLTDVVSAGEEGDITLSG